ncbi:hypothetical protein ACJX0J_024670, partial [Zea mays]
LLVVTTQNFMHMNHQLILTIILSFTIIQANQRTLLRIAEEKGEKTRFQLQRNLFTH